MDYKSTQGFVVMTLGKFLFLILCAVLIQFSWTLVVDVYLRNSHFWSQLYGRRSPPTTSYTSVVPCVLIFSHCLMRPGKPELIVTRLTGAPMVGKYLSFTSLFRFPFRCLPGNSLSSCQLVDVFNIEWKWAPKRIESLGAETISSYFQTLSGQEVWLTAVEPGVECGTQWAPFDKQNWSCGGNQMLGQGAWWLIIRPWEESGWNDSIEKKMLKIFHVLFF